MSRIGYINPRFYQARHTWPQPDSSKACPQAANEPRAGESNKPSPPPVTPETPNSANSLNPSAGVEQSEPYMRLLTLIDCELCRNGQSTWEGGAKELQRELTKERERMRAGSPPASHLEWSVCAPSHRAHPERIARIHHTRAREWLIYHPAQP